MLLLSFAIGKVRSCFGLFFLTVAAKVLSDASLRDLSGIIIKASRGRCSRDTALRDYKLKVLGKVLESLMSMVNGVVPRDGTIVDIGQSRDIASAKFLSSFKPSLVIAGVYGKSAEVECSQEYAFIEHDGVYGE